MNKSLDSVINDFVTQEPKATAREYLRLALELLELDRDLELNSLIWLEDKTKKQLLKKSDAILNKLGERSPVDGARRKGLTNAIDQVLDYSKRNLNHRTIDDTFDVQLEKIALSKVLPFLKDTLKQIEIEKESGQNERLTRIVIFAATIGGLAFEPWLESLLALTLDKSAALYKQQSTSKPSIIEDIKFGKQATGRDNSYENEKSNDFYFLSGNAVFELFYLAKGHPTNRILQIDALGTQSSAILERDLPVELGSSAEHRSSLRYKISSKLWYPDPLSLLSICGYLKNSHVDSSNELNPLNILNAFVKKFRKYSPGTSISRQQFWQACGIASQYLFHEKKAPNNTLQYNLGNLASASQSISSLAALHGISYVHSADKPLKIDRLNELASRLQLKNRSSSVDNVAESLAELKSICVAENILIKDKQELPPSQSREQTIGRLKQYQQDSSNNIQTEILTEWLIDNLTKNKWEHGKGTAARYLNAIGDAWLEFWQDKELLEYDPNDMQDAFELISKQKEQSYSSAPAVLSLLFDFIGKYYSEISVPYSIAQDKSYLHVRSNIISQKHFQQLRYDMNKHYRHETELYRLAVDCILLMLRRTNARPSEIYSAMLSELKLSKDMTLKIRPNKYGGVKTSSGKRNIKLKLYMTPEELSIIKLFVNARRRSVGSDSDALLFSQRQDHDAMFGRRTINEPAIELLSKYAGRRIAFYSLRHTGVSSLQLVIEGDEQFTEQLIAYENSQQQSIRKSLQTKKMGGYYELSGLNGHLSPSTSTMVYCHFFDMVQHMHSATSNYKISARLLQNLSATSYKRMNKLRKFRGLTVYGTNVLQFANKVFKPYAKQLVAKQPRSIGSKKIIHQDIPLTYLDCERVLLLQDGGKNKDSIEKDVGVSSAYIADILNSARTIKLLPLYSTERGNSRLFPQDSERLCPRIPPFPNDKQERNRLIDFFVAKVENKPKLVLNIIDKVLSNALEKRNEVHFYSPTEATQFLNFFADVLPPERWTALIKTDRDTTSEWKYLLGLVGYWDVLARQKLDKNTKRGRLTLTLLRKKLSESETAHNIKSKPQIRSSIALVSACHLYMIFRSRRLQG